MILDLLHFSNISSKITLNITRHNKIHGSESGQSKSPAIFTRLDFYRSVNYSKLSTSFLTVSISSSSCFIFLSTTRNIASFQTC